jgi:Dolichyl-phosphate-mannose-protein mannosyltransferase
VRLSDYGRATGWEVISSSAPAVVSAAAVITRAPARPGESDRQRVLIPPAPRPGPRQPAPFQPAARQGALKAGPDQKFSHLPWLSLLVVVLSIQAALSLLFLHANTAFGDEALYLWAGHLEWSHWLHGTRIPAFPTWFSGSPVIYPPIGALADSIGGLAGARALSMCFMLGSTCLVWATTTRLFGRQAAFFSAALFAVIGPTLHLGAFATYDPMALFLLALAAWCACGARTREDATGWMLACAVTLALANATKYATLLFDPIVILMAVQSACPQPGGKVALRRAALLLTCLAGSLAVLLRLGGSWYITGITQTTTMRPNGADTVSKVLAESWQWLAVVVLVALAGLVVSLVRRDQRPVAGLIAVLFCAALLAPAEQARIQTTVSLGKHVDFGAWFACIAGGYALATLASLPRRKTAQVLAAACLSIAVVPAAAEGLLQARGMVNWPGSGRLIAYLRPLTSHGGHFLADTDDVPEYYLTATTWRQWSNVFSITRNGRVRDEHGSMVPYQKAIKQHYFSLVVLNFANTPLKDDAITAALRSTPGYKLVKYVPYTGPVHGNYVIWAYRPAVKADRP